MPNTIKTISFHLLDVPVFWDIRFPPYGSRFFYHKGVLFSIACFSGLVHHNGADTLFVCQTQRIFKEDFVLVRLREIEALQKADILPLVCPRGIGGKQNTVCAVLADNLQALLGITIKDIRRVEIHGLAAELLEYLVG